ncbi:MAG: hypothetical protein ACJ77M_14675 [Thermoleophilaceae bacterium]
MRNRALHDALRDLALDAAALLSSELRAGHEIPFDVVEEPGRGPILYRYRPLTKQFLASRWDKLRALPTWETAARALGAGASIYLRVCGLPEGADPEPALQAMLERLYEDSTSFDFPEERFERVYSSVERTLFEDTITAAVLTPVHGLVLENTRVELGDGIVLVDGRTIDAPAEAVWPPTTLGERDRDAEPATLCVLERALAPDAPIPVTESRIRFRKLLTALRLFKPGGIALDPLAWGRVDEGVWKPLPLGLGGTARGEPWFLEAAEVPELVAFLGLVSRSHHAGRVAWALSRFEMGCERALHVEALSDYLLALQALLDAEDDAGRATLSRRVAALCAEESQRRALQRRVELAFALERFLVGGGSIDAYVESVGSPNPPHEIVREVETHLRAMLRDVLCGYLPADLKSAADDILLRSGEPLEIRARDLRRPSTVDRRPSTEEPEPEPKPAQRELRFTKQPEPEPEPEPEPKSVDGRRSTVDGEEPDDRGVTPSADWQLDDDPASYSAPI